METIELKKKFSTKLRLIITFMIFAITIAVLSYFITKNNYPPLSYDNFNESYMIFMIIFIIIALPFIGFIIPNDVKNGKSSFTHKKDLVSKRKRKYYRTRLTGSTLKKAY